VSRAAARDLLDVLGIDLALVQAPIGRSPANREVVGDYEAGWKSDPT